MQTAVGHVVGEIQLEFEAQLVHSSQILENHTPISLKNRQRNPYCKTKFSIDK
jgi:hypothetical protein